MVLGRDNGKTLGSCDSLKASLLLSPLSGSKPVLILNAADVESCIDMDEAIAASREALGLLVQGRAEIPVRQHIGVAEDNPSVSLYMPGFVPDLGVLGLKVATLMTSNPGHGLPTTPCVILLVNPDTGFLDALMEATWLTNVKTGGSTGVATDLLAREDAEVYAVLGAGSIAYHQVEGVLTVRPKIARVLLWNRTRDRAEELAASLRSSLPKGVKFEVVDDAAAAVAAADIVTACTSANEPVVLGAWVQPGTHVNLVGAHGADMREGDDLLLSKAAIAAVDKIEGAQVSGDVALAVVAGIRSISDFIDIGRVMNGDVSGRQSSEQITWYKSVGNAAQDLVTAQRVLYAARIRGLGREVELNPAESAK